MFQQYFYVQPFLEGNRRMPKKIVEIRMRVSGASLHAWRIAVRSSSVSSRLSLRNEEQRFDVPFYGYLPDGAMSEHISDGIRAFPIDDRG
jgi:hypothetical protein